MRDILPLIQNPSHYLGTEVNAVHKRAGEVRLRVALAFPDVYEVGMAYVGQRILYNLVNQRQHWWAERVFAPGQDVAAVMREHSTPLCTLESDTPLAQLDVVAFSLTHELCYTTVLHMLDLAGIPFRAADRGGEWPLIIGGGGMAFQPEPVAPFFDLLGVGDGEEVLPEVLELVDRARKRGWSKAQCLESMQGRKGIYVPAGQGPGAATHVTRRVAPDLNRIDYPTRQVVPFGKVVHDRYSLEIARGCTRGCRFCHAGMVYRPVRERGLPVLDGLLCRGLDQTGFEEVSFLSLSTGDYSTLEGLFGQSLDRCRAEQISISLPSLRVGSLNPRLMAMISGIRRTGATLAPEAGSQRLRDVINKGITEEELLDHTGSLFRLGWNGVKLYFMIGLPTEREEDLRAIQELCLKVLATAGKKSRRLQVTASISPFVPKPHTPFQWEEQLSMEQVRSRLALLKRLFAPHRRLALRWQEPEMSFVEGVFARGDRALAPVIERAYGLGDTLTAWAEHFSLARWLTAFEMEGVDPRAYHRARDPEGPLPWDHIDAGISREFLLRERGRALSGKATQDCRYGRCGQCGACDTKKDEVPDGGAGPLTVMPRLNQAFRDQTGQGAGEQEPGRERLDTKADHLRLWYAKTGPAAYLSQLELQRIFERAFRRAKMDMTFSSGFHPLPLISFGRALPVGVGSLEEWLNIYLRQECDPDTLLPAINAQLPGGLVLERIERLGMGRRQPQAVAEDFCLTYRRPGSSGLAAWGEVMQLGHLWIDRKTRKGVRRKDVRSFLKEVSTIDQQRVCLRLTWESDYLSPLVIVRSVDQQSSPRDFHLVKVRQWMEGEEQGCLGGSVPRSGLVGAKGPCAAQGGVLFSAGEQKGGTAGNLKGGRA